ncbi:N-acetyltransferase 9-like protein [Cladobotryum mycophilum]|uniref:N-acetyltransferase 9-like protein n=1 Tax=Cladobotryum mycophilum TaxID=491253 RepID=A0ABR0SP33_9HYPO
MKVNEKIAVATNKVLLVPYEAHHVVKYHGWMQDPDIQEATASEPMSLEEEYENQQSWRTSHDKLTFILCEPVNGDLRAVEAQVQDSDDKTRGDINFFLYPDDEDEEPQVGKRLLRGEVDVMIAEKESRGKGMGEGSVRTLLAYIRRHLKEILSEYSEGEGAGQEEVLLVGLMAKIKEGNVGSRALFTKLGFRQEGEVNYFGEVKMVMDWDVVEKGEGCLDGIGEGELAYHEVSYEGLSS